MTPSPQLWQSPETAQVFLGSGHLKAHSVTCCWLLPAAGQTPPCAPAPRAWAFSQHGGWPRGAFPDGEAATDGGRIIQLVGILSSRHDSNLHSEGLRAWSSHVNGAVASSAPCPEEPITWPRPPRPRCLLTQWQTGGRLSTHCDHQETVLPWAPMRTVPGWHCQDAVEDVTLRHSPRGL